MVSAHWQLHNLYYKQAPRAGTGQFPFMGYRDSNGDYLDGANTYRLHLPADVPVKQFWQVPIYDVETRSIIATDQK
ncbi:MAG: DUF1214 domain-containing protein, partial [Vicinamibacterales bacterium]